MTRIGMLLIALALDALPAHAQTMDRHSASHAMPQDHLAVSPGDLKWAPQGPPFPPGGEIAVILGDPGKPGPYILRARVPAGYKVPPHTHPGDENITVISGTFHIAPGRTFDTSKGVALKAGSFTMMPRGMAHYAWFSEPTEIQVHGEGPFGITYLDPADDPRNPVGKSN